MFNFKSLVRCILAVGLLCGNLGHAQDTLKVMSYNVLQFGVSSCSPITSKQASLKTIIDYALPDIVGLNEVAADDAYVNGILAKSFNVSGRTNYAKANTVNESGAGDFINPLIYNTKKLGYASTTSLQKSVRDVVLYRLYHRSADLATGGDTIWINVVVCHLKAGNTGQDEQSRFAMVNQAMVKLNSLGVKGNILWLGDLNVYSGNETCFQRMVASAEGGDLTFYDPIDKIGSWSENSTYAGIHTQSTRGADGAGCASTGGSDDRFDFVLINAAIKDKTDKVSYITDSYRTLGQDGLHYNKGILEGGNTSLPSAVLNAVYLLSDHMPVELALMVDANRVSIQDQHTSKGIIADLQIVGSQTTASISGQLVVYDFTGRVLTSTALRSGQAYSFQHLKSGAYIFQFQGDNGQIVIRKIIYSRQ